MQSLAALILGIYLIYSTDNADAAFCITMTVLFVIFRDLALGTVTWIYVPEIMTERGFSLAMSANWLFAFLVTLIPQYFENPNVIPYIFFGSFLVLTQCFLFCKYVMKETRGLNPDEVATLYNNN